MKKLTSIFVFAMLLLAFSPSVFMVGCAGPERSREYQVFDSYRTVYNVAETAYTTFTEEYVRGKVKQSTKDKVDARWNQFREVFSTSLVASRRDWNAVPDAEVRKLANELLNLINTL